MVKKYTELLRPDNKEQYRSVFPFLYYGYNRNNVNFTPTCYMYLYAY